MVEKIRHSYSLQTKVTPTTLEDLQYRNLEDIYTIISKISIDSFGIVYKVKCVCERKFLAAKCISTKTIYKNSGQLK